MTNTKSTRRKSKKSASDFQIGERVIARFKGKRTFYAGVIVGIDLKKNRCDIDYIDGDKDRSLAVKFIRKNAPAPGTGNSNNATVKNDIPSVSSKDKTSVTGSLESDNTATIPSPGREKNAGNESPHANDAIVAEKTTHALIGRRTRRSSDANNLTSTQDIELRDVVNRRGSHATNDHGDSVSLDMCAEPVVQPEPIVTEWFWKTEKKYWNIPNTGWIAYPVGTKLLDESGKVKITNHIVYENMVNREKQMVPPTLMQLAKCP